MKTSSFEVNFINALNHHIANKHALLTVSSPATDGYDANLIAYVPDIVVSNPTNGKTLILEVKGGRTSNTVPFATVSKLKRFRGVVKDVVMIQLVSSADVPPTLKAMLEESSIGLTNTESVDEAIRQIDSILEQMER